MRSIGIRDLKNNLSRVIHQVAAGASMDITDHGHVVARLSPPHPAAPVDAFDSLVAAGVLLPASETGKPFVAWPVLSRSRSRRGLAATLIDEDRGS
jgi:antitoxin (DNA-binding transcriptional repressor) of toxin-antitoxin stability system